MGGTLRCFLNDSCPLSLHWKSVLLCAPRICSATEGRQNNEALVFREMPLVDPFLHPRCAYPVNSSLSFLSGLISHPTSLPSLSASMSRTSRFLCSDRPFHLSMSPALSVVSRAASAELSCFMENDQLITALNFTGMWDGACIVIMPKIVAVAQGFVSRCSCSTLPLDVC